MDATTSRFNLGNWKGYMNAQKAKIPVLPQVEDVSARVIRIMAGNPSDMTLQGTNTYLVGTGRRRILIDTGEGLPQWTYNVVETVQSRGLDISHILLTHWHSDHTGGVADLILYNRKYGSRVYKNQPDPGQRPITNGQVFRVDGATVRAVFTPGHSVDHMCFVLEEENAMFTGDNVLGHGHSVVDDLGEYMDSLSHMASQNCQTGYPGHGSVITDLPAKIKSYILAKEAREKMIVSALSNGTSGAQGGNIRPRKTSLSTSELLYAMHGDLASSPTLQESCIPFIIQVLCKLTEEGKVGFEMVLGQRKWFLCKKGRR